MNGLVNRFMETRKMMKQLGQGGGLPGMPGMPGARRPAKQQPKAKKKNTKGVSGNPAKRTGAEAPAAAVAAGSAFGAPQTEADMAKAMADFQLPPELQKMFNEQN